MCFLLQRCWSVELVTRMRLNVAASEYHGMQHHRLGPSLRGRALPRSDSKSLVDSVLLWIFLFLK